MKIGKACAIFLQIDSEEYTVIEKGEAIYHVMNMPTHNGIKKDVMLSVIKWLFNQCFSLEERNEAPDNAAYWEREAKKLMAAAGEERLKCCETCSHRGLGSRSYACDKCSRKPRVDMYDPE